MDTINAPVPTLKVKLRGGLSANLGANLDGDTLQHVGWIVDSYISSYVLLYSTPICVTLHVHNPFISKSKT